MKKLSAIAALLLSTNTFAASLYEPFNYAYTTPPPGTSLNGLINPATNQEWFRMGNTTTDDEILISQGNLSIDGLAKSVGNSIAYQGTGKTERISFGTTPVQAGTVYYSFAFQLTGLTGLTTGGGFVAGFNNLGPTAGVDNQPTTIGSRLYLKLGATPNTYIIGIGKNPSAPANASFDTIERQLNTPIFIVASYTFNSANTTDDTAQMWINPDKSNFASAILPSPTLINSSGPDLLNGGNSLGSFLFRQGNATVPNVNADELRVDTTWAGVTGVSWTSPGGPWSNSANWSGGTVPNAIGAEVNFPPSPFGSPFPTVATIDSPQTVGAITFTADDTITIDGTQALTMQTPTGNSSLHHASIITYAGSHIISAPLRLASNTTVNVIPADSKLTLSGGISIATGTPNLTKIGPGSLELGNFQVNDLNITAGNVKVSSGAGVNRANNLTLAATSTLDLANNTLVLTNAAALANVTALVKSARGNGSWTGIGITSSAAAADPLRSSGLAAILNDKGDGTPVNSAYPTGAVVIKYTWDGDANLDGVINPDDFALIDQGYIESKTGYQWGDFDYSGTIDADDFFLIDRAFSNQSAGLAAQVQSVPEPSSVILLSFISTIVLSRCYRLLKVNDFSSSSPPRLR